MHTQFWISDDVELVCSRGAFDYPLHSHVSMLTLNCVRSGQVTLSTRSGTAHYRAGECFGIQPHISHSLSRSADSDIVSVCCAAQYAYVEGILNHRCVQNALAELQNNKLLAGHEVEKCTNILSFMPCRLAESAIDDAATHLLFVALETRSEENIPLAQLSLQCGRSVWHAIRRFREVTGLTPHQFQIQNRIRQAKRLLREKTSLTDAALSAGFCDQSHLNRCLLRAVGLTPARYRAACHNVTCAGAAFGSAQRRKKFGKQT